MKYEFKGLLDDKLPSGNIRWRVRVKGEPNRKIRIPMGPGEPGFDAHYSAARKGLVVEATKPLKPVKGTLDELCDNYLAYLAVQVAGANLSKATYESRKRGLRQACEVRDIDEDRFGSLHADLPREGFMAIWDSFGARTGAAETCFKALKAAYKWGEDRGYPQNSPIRTMASTHKPKGGAVAWDDKEVENFLSRHGPGTMARLWFCLADCTAGRIGDMPSFGRENITTIDGEMAISWQPSKPGSKRVTVLVTEMLRIELENHDIDADVYLLTAHGRPFNSSGSLDNRVRKWIVQAGITDKDGKANRSQHGIRKGVAELLARMGATEYEIMTTLGHSDPRTSRIYTEKTERIGLGVSASLKRRGRG